MNDLCVWIEWVILTFKSVGPNIYYILGSNSIACLVPVALASLIEGNWCICILLLFVIDFNPYNVYALLYGAST